MKKSAVSNIYPHLVNKPTRPSILKRMYVVGASTFIVVGSTYLAWTWYVDHHPLQIQYLQPQTHFNRLAVQMLDTPTPIPVGPMKLPIVMYHYVEYVQDPKDTIRKSLDINPELFEHQLKSLINAGYSFYFVRELPSVMKGQRPFIEKNITLTFDDGYEDFYTEAFPILKKHTIKSTLYVINDFIDRKGYLTENQLKEIRDSGLVEIGAHTLDHVALKHAPHHVAEKQIIDSKTKLEKRFGIRVETFAYPYGSFDDQAVALVKKAGYTMALTTLNGTVQTQDRLFTMYRIRAGMLNGIYSAKIVENLRK